MLTALREFVHRVLRSSVALAMAAGVYVGGFVNTSVATGWGIVSQETARRLDTTVYAPMRWYSSSELPGGRELLHAREWCYWVCRNVRP